MTDRNWSIFVQFDFFTLTIVDECRFQFLLTSDQVNMNDVHFSLTTEKVITKKREIIREKSENETNRKEKKEKKSKQDSTIESG